mmetsp:Transcript_186/g.795  ORF Transcript_186/g.795 Transcript_186/m.795 type:complete len:217 (+) Transcript_186:1422-2072(+)
MHDIATTNLQKRVHVRIVLARRHERRPFHVRRFATRRRRTRAVFVLERLIIHANPRPHLGVRQHPQTPTHNVCVPHIRRSMTRIEAKRHRVCAHVRRPRELASRARLFATHNHVALRRPRQAHHHSRAPRRAVQAPIAVHRRRCGVRARGDGKLGEIINRHWNEHEIKRPRHRARDGIVRRRALDDVIVRFDANVRGVGEIGARTEGHSRRMRARQ